MKINFSKKYYWRKKSDRLRSWVMGCGLATVMGYSLWRYLGEWVIPDEYKQGSLG